MSIEKPLVVKDTKKKQKKEWVSFNPEIFEDIKLRQIWEAAPALFNLAQKIVREGSRYDLVLSDDTSGRLVSLFLKKVLDEVQKQRGQTKPEIRFAPSGQNIDTEKGKAIRQLLEEINPKRTLISTEWIKSGYSMEQLITILQKLKLNFDVATLSAVGEGVEVINGIITKNPDTKFFIGEYGDVGYRSFYGVQGRRLSGVQRKANYPFLQRNISEHIPFDDMGKEKKGKECNKQ